MTSTPLMQNNRWFWLAIGAISFGLIYILHPILLPFIIGLLLAYLGDPVVDKLETYKISRTVSVLILFLVFLVVLLPILLILIPLLEGQIKTLITKLPGYIEWIGINLAPTVKEYLGFDLPDMGAIKESFANDFDKSSGILKGFFKTISASSMVVLAMVANIFLIPVITFYLLRDWDVLVEYIHDLLPRDIEPRVTKLAKQSDNVLGAFLRGQMLVMLALGTLYAIGLKLVGLEFSLLIGLLAGLLSFIPYMGLIVGILVAGVAVILQTQDPTQLIWVFLVFGVAQMIEGTVLTPLLVGDRIGLHPVTVIFAVLAGGQLFGFFGILLALPVFAVIGVLMRDFKKSYKGSDIYSKTEQLEEAESLPSLADKDTDMKDEVIAEKVNENETKG